MIFRILLLIVILPFIASGTILFDGSFQAIDNPEHGLGSHYDSANFGNWTDYGYCIPQDNSITIMDADGIKTGMGKMARFEISNGSSYDCGGNQHDQIYWNPGLGEPTGIPNPYNDIWYGWSEKLGQNATEWTLSHTGSDWINFGFSGGSSIYKNGGAGNTGLLRTFWEEDPHIHLGINQHFYTLTDAGDYGTSVGTWFDWKYHVVWENNNTGSLYVWYKLSNESNYTLLYSNVSMWTEYIGFDSQTEENNVIVPRSGLYRNSESNTTNVIYILNPKIATTEEEVEYSASTTVTTPTATSTIPAWTSITASSVSWEDTWTAIPWVYIACFAIIGYGFYSIFKEMI